MLQQIFSNYWLQKLEEFKDLSYTKFYDELPVKYREKVNHLGWQEYLKNIDELKILLTDYAFPDDESEQQSDPQNTLNKFLGEKQ